MKHHMFNTGRHVRRKVQVANVIVDDQLDACILDVSVLQCGAHNETNVRVTVGRGELRAELFDHSVECEQVWVAEGGSSLDDLYVLVLR